MILKKPVKIVGSRRSSWWYPRPYCVCRQRMTVLVTEQAYCWSLAFEEHRSWETKTHQSHDHHPIIPPERPQNNTFRQQTERDEQNCECRNGDVGGEKILSSVLRSRPDADSWTFHSSHLDTRSIRLAADVDGGVRSKPYTPRRPRDGGVCAGVLLLWDR